MHHSLAQNAQRAVTTISDLRRGDIVNFRITDGFPDMDSCLAGKATLLTDIPSNRVEFRIDFLTQGPSSYVDEIISVDSLNFFRLVSRGFIHIGPPGPEEAALVDNTTPSLPGRYDSTHRLTEFSFDTPPSHSQPGNIAVLSNKAVLPPYTEREDHPLVVIPNAPQKTIKLVDWHYAIERHYRSNEHRFSFTTDNEVTIAVTFAYPAGRVRYDREYLNNVAVAYFSRTGELRGEAVLTSREECLQEPFVSQLIRELEQRQDRAKNESLDFIRRLNTPGSDFSFNNVEILSPREAFTQSWMRTNIFKDNGYSVGYTAVEGNLRVRTIRLLRNESGQQSFFPKYAYELEIDNTGVDAGQQFTLFADSWPLTFQERVERMRGIDGEMRVHTFDDPEARRAFELLRDIHEGTNVTNRIEFRLGSLLAYLKATFRF